MKYTAEYDSFSIRNVDTDCMCHKYIEEFLREGLIGLDIGCGTCRKIIPLHNKFRNFTCLDKSPLMLSKAKENIEVSKVHNITLQEGDVNQIEFKENTFDIVTCMLAPYDLNRISRWLKPKGKFFLEVLGANDKRELKRIFGKDELGWRGLYYELTEKEHRSRIELEFKKYFDIIMFSEDSWETTLEMGGMIKVLEMTPTIRGFDINKDREILNIVNDNGNVTFTENRFYLLGEKKDNL